MSQQERRLAAIMFTDIVGYTALMQSDEQAALSAVEMHKRLLESSCRTHSGEVVQYYGDGSLSVFNSVYDALRCAMDIQKHLRNNVPLRIGIHIGEIVQKGDDIFGDGVNVASRVESAGVAGAVLVSSFAYDKVKNQSEFEFLKLGAFQLKNVSAPIVLYALQHPDLADAGILVQSAARPKKKTASRLIPGVLITVLAVIVFFAIRGDFVGRTAEEPVTTANSNGKLNSVAVFPFDVQGTADLAYLREGLVDLFSTKIDGMAGLSAVDPNITIAKAAGYKSKRLDKETTARLTRELGANEFIIGNVIIFGDQIRIKISEYDVSGELMNNAEVVFDSQSELLEAVDELVLKTLAKRYSIVRQDMIASSILMSDNLEAVKAFLEGEEYRRSGFFDQASQSYVNATNFDSTMSMAWLRMGQVCSWSGVCAYSDGRIYRNARKYKSTLPPKMRDYVELATRPVIWMADGPADIKKLIDRYGKNVDLMVLYGEALFHGSIIRGESAIEALEPMLEAYRYDPGNTEVLTHIVQLLIYSQNVDQIKRIVEEVPPGSRFWPVLHTAWYITREEGWTSTEVEEIYRHPGFDFEAIFAYCRTENRMPEFLAFTTDLEELKGSELEARNIPAQALMCFWQGRESEGLKRVLGSRMFESMMIYGMPVLAWRPEGAYGEEILNELEERLTSGNINGIYPDDFALALNALRLDNTAQYNLHLEVLDSLANDVEKVKRYILICRAFQYHKQEEYQQSNEAVQEVLRMQPGVSIGPSQAFITNELAGLMAENYAALRNYPTAIKYYNHAYEVLSGGGDITLAYSWIRRAELYEQIGEYQSALNMVNRFLDLWQDSDEKYKPWYNKAKELRDRVFSQLQ